MKRMVLVSAGLVFLAVGILLASYTVRQEREFQRLIAEGDAALLRDETYGAIEAFSGALALKRDSMLAYLKRGDTYRRRGELTAALRDLREAAGLDPSAPRPVELLGDVNADLGRYERAAQHYLAFTALDDRSPRVLYKLALARFRTGDAAAAIDPLRQAVRLDARFAEAHYLLALCLRARSQDADALEALTRALEINPAFVAARDELADLHLRAGRQEQAIEQLEAIAAIEPSRPERLITVGLAYASWGRTDAAVLTLGRAAERHPDHRGVYTALARVWLEAADARNDRVALSKALEALQPQIAAGDPSTDALMLYGRAMYLSGTAAAAERALLQATATPPVEPVALRYLADAAERLGHRAEARDARLRYAALTGDESTN